MKVIKSIKQSELFVTDEGHLNVDGRGRAFSPEDDVFVSLKGVSRVSFRDMVIVQQGLPTLTTYILPNSAALELINKENDVFIAKKSIPNKYALENWVCVKQNAVVFETAGKVDIYKKFPIYLTDNELITLVKKLINERSISVSGDRVKETDKALSKLANSDKINNKLKAEQLFKLVTSLGMTVDITIARDGDKGTVRWEPDSRVMDSFS